MHATTSHHADSNVAVIRLGAVLSALTALSIAAVWPVAVAAAGRTRVPAGPDGYGYTLTDQTSGACPCSFVDIATTGTPLTFTASGTAAANDDGGAVVALAAPFRFYGRSVTSVVVSTNGYIAPATSLAEEDGGDFSNDPVIPAVPDDQGPSSARQPARLMAFHDDLAAGPGGGACIQYFSSCPRPSEALGAEPCTVIQWSGWSANSSTATFDLEAILYHHSFQVVYQTRGATVGGSGTVGIQDWTAQVGLQYAPVTPGTLADATAVCIFEPRFPAGGPRADLAAYSNVPDGTFHPGDTLAIDVSADDFGPSDGSSVVVSATLPPALQYVSDTCGGAFSRGAWNAGTVPDRGEATCTITARLRPGASGTLSGNVTVGGAETDPDPSNNSTPFSIVASSGVDLALRKTSDAVEPVATGSTFNYSLSVTNHGTTTATGVVVLDQMPSQLAVLGSTCGAAYDSGRGAWAWNVGSVAAGSEVGCVFSVRLPSATTGTAVNTASVSSNQVDDAPADNTASVALQLGGSGGGIPAAGALGLGVLAALVAAAGALLVARRPA